MGLKQLRLGQESLRNSFRSRHPTNMASRENPKGVITVLSFYHPSWWFSILYLCHFLPLSSVPGVVSDYKTSIYCFYFGVTVTYGHFSFVRFRITYRVYMEW